MNGYETITLKKALNKKVKVITNGISIVCKVKDIETKVVQDFALELFEPENNLTKSIGKQFLTIEQGQCHNVQIVKMY